MLDRRGGDGHGEKDDLRFVLDTAVACSRLPEKCDTVE